MRRLFLSTFLASVFCILAKQTTLLLQFSFVEQAYSPQTGRGCRLLRAASLIGVVVGLGY